MYLSYLEIGELPWNSQSNKGAKIRNRYNQVPHLTQDTNGKLTNSQLDTTNESHEFSPFPAGDHKAQIYRRAQRHRKYINDSQKVSKHVLLEGLNQFYGANLTLGSDLS